MWLCGIREWLDSSHALFDSNVSNPNITQLWYLTDVLSYRYCSHSIWMMVCETRMFCVSGICSRRHCYLRIIGEEATASHVSSAPFDGRASTFDDLTLAVLVLSGSKHHDTHRCCGKSKRLTWSVNTSSRGQVQYYFTAACDDYFNSAADWLAAYNHRTWSCTGFVDQD